VEFEHVALTVFALSRAHLGLLGAVLDDLPRGARHTAILLRPDGSDVHHEALARDFPPRLGDAALVQGVRAPQLPVGALQAVVVEAPAAEAAA
jgi:hypothetical protein